MQDHLNDAFIFLGSNVERERNYLEALRRLVELGTLRAVSPVYETAPIGSCCEYFYNGAARLETPLNASALRLALRRIEAQLGRVRTADRNAPRTIDLDLVLFNKEQLTGPGWQIPDPLIFKRPFMAQALAELDPAYVHPVAGRTLAELAGAETAAETEASSGTNENLTRVDPAMTARVRDWFDHLYVGEISHA